MNKNIAIPLPTPIAPIDNIIILPRESRFQGRA